MAGNRHLNRLTSVLQSPRFARLTSVLQSPRFTRISSAFQTRQGAVASALVAGAVVTTTMTVATQAPAESAVLGAAPITAMAEGGKAAKSLGAEDADRKGTAKKKAVEADDVIKLAESQVGVTEDGSGESKFGRWYADTERAQETMERDSGGGSPEIYRDAAWCSMFISWLGDRLDFSDQMGKDAWTITHAEWFEDHGRWGREPKPGAVVFFDWDGGRSLQGIDHVGLVTGVRGDNTIETVEGNTDDAVKARTRTVDDVVGFGYPDYDK